MNTGLDFCYTSVHLEAEAGGEGKVAVAVVKTVPMAGVPMSLMVSRKGIEEVAGSAHECHLGGQISGKKRAFAINRIGETMAVSEARGKSDVIQPTMMKDPTVAIANQNTVVAVTETVVGHFVGEMGRKFRAQGTHIHHYVLVTRIDAREQRTGTAFLVLGETVGCRLAVMGVVEDIIGIKAVTLSFQTRENLVTVPFSQPIEVKRALVMLAVIGLDKDARRGEREL